MKRIVIDIILIVGFVLLLTVIILPFVAEVQFERAQRLEQDYQWNRAGEKYQLVLHLDPFKAEYFAGAGDFLVRQSRYRKGEGKVYWLKRAERLYERASGLNPSYAEYWYLLGKVRLEIASLTSSPLGTSFARNDGGKTARNDEIDKIMQCFREAIEKDPYNFRNNYLVGYDLFTVWDNLDDAEKKFALNRFRYVLKTQPWYGNFVYPAIIYYAQDFSLAEGVTPQSLSGYQELYSFITSNNLWQYRKQIEESVDFYRQRQEPEEFEKEREERKRLLQSLRLSLHSGLEDDSERSEESRSLAIDWVGKSKDGKEEYRNGNMYWEGTVDVAVEIPEGKAKINIMAKGTPANNVFPYMIVELDDEEIDETYVDSVEWKEYPFYVDTNGGIKVLSVTFANDGGNEEREEDRNLFVGDVTVERVP